MSDVAAVVLAAGRGSRLRPLSDVLPKPLCPVGNVALLDWALGRARTASSDIAVNVHYGRDLMDAHLAGAGVHVSVEEGDALGTAGALGRLRDWIDGRAVLVVNSDAWTEQPLERLLAQWDGKRPRLLVVDDPDRADFGGRWRFAGASVMAWADVCGLAAEPSGLYERVWGPAESEGRLELVPGDGPFFDCGTPGEYLAANLAWSGGESVIGPGAVVDGEVVRSVVWPDGVVRAGEQLVEAIRVGELLTVQPWV